MKIDAKSRDAALAVKCEAQWFESAKSCCWEGKNGAARGLHCLGSASMQAQPIGEVQRPPKHTRQCGRLT